MTRRYFGQPGHFIAANYCRFHLHTHVGRFCVSTVGDYHPPKLRAPREREEQMEQVGLDRFFETMVFALGDNDSPVSWSNIDFDAYNDRDAANAGHERMVRRYEERAVAAEAGANELVSKLGLDVEQP